MPELPKDYISWMKDNMADCDSLDIDWDNKQMPSYVVEFVVTKEGKIKDVRFRRKGVDYPKLESEIIRLLESLPGVTPGMQGGSPVNVEYTIPLVWPDLFDRRKAEYPAGAQGIVDYLNEEFVDKESISGLLVFVWFGIDEFGTLSDISLSAHKGKDLPTVGAGQSWIRDGFDFPRYANKELYNVIKKMPGWKPTNMCGHNTETFYKEKRAFVIILDEKNQIKMHEDFKEGRSITVWR
ncbi:hypothetical protein AAIR98_000635 [Elusimicrobium simillimum]|uniref:hypothetical protein n=1 Tax=Elusimicrobium simillimum TaxID=3143438 RepID=UPI003C6EBD14